MDVQDKRIFIRVAFNVPQDKKDEQFSMEPITLVDVEQLGRGVKLLSDVIGEGLEAEGADPEPGMRISPACA